MNVNDGRSPLAMQSRASGVVALIMCMCGAWAAANKASWMEQLATKLPALLATVWDKPNHVIRYLVMCRVGWKVGVGVERVMCNRLARPRHPSLHAAAGKAVATWRATSRRHIPPCIAV